MYGNRTSIFLLAKFVISNVVSVRCPAEGSLNYSAPSRRDRRRIRSRGTYPNLRGRY